MAPAPEWEQTNIYNVRVLSLCANKQLLLGICVMKTGGLLCPGMRPVLSPEHGPR